MSLHIGVKKEPRGRWDEKKGDRHLHLFITDREWEQLFHDVLLVPINEPYIHSDEQDEHFKMLFQENLKDKGYEMLGRIWDVYDDVFYFPSDINKLLEECLEVQQKTENIVVIAILEKIIFACQEALKVKSGLSLRAD